MQSNEKRLLLPYLQKRLWLLKPLGVLLWLTYPLVTTYVLLTSEDAHIMRKEYMEDVKSLFGKWE